MPTTLILEDGTGVPDANTYALVADADAYFTLLGNVAWAGTADAKEQALIKAARYVDEVYHQRWLGDKANEGQGRQWPRVGVVLDGFTLDGTELPRRLVEAQFEAAVRYLTQELRPDLSPGADGFITGKTVGPIEVTLAPGYGPNRRYQVIEDLLAPLLRGAPGVTEVVRA